jgi:hypothetical protein
MTEEEYFQERLEDQISWFGKKSSYNQKMYKRLVLVEILLSVSIPFMTAYVSNDTPELKFVIGGMGIMIALIAGIMSVYKFQELWVNYRTTSETLLQEKYLYLTRSGMYQENRTSRPYNDFVLRIENILSDENLNWKQQTLSVKEEIVEEEAS